MPGRPPSLARRACSQADYPWFKVGGQGSEKGYEDKVFYVWFDATWLHFDYKQTRSVAVVAWPR